MNLTFSANRTRFSFLFEVELINDLDLFPGLDGCLVQDAEKGHFSFRVLRLVAAFFLCIFPTLNNSLNAEYGPVDGAQAFLVSTGPR
jgi:hypothetical protein